MRSDRSRKDFWSLGGWGLAAPAWLLAATGLVLPSPAAAVIIPLTATLDSAQEVPSNTSPGEGTGRMTFDTGTGRLDWTITYSGLTGPAIQAHFHGPAEPGANAPVQVDFAPISGLTSPLTGNIIVTEMQSQHLLDGLWYINVHTAQYPGGEIRGQVVVAENGQTTVAEPGTLALLLAGGLGGFAGLGLTRRRGRAAQGSRVP